MHELRCGCALLAGGRFIGMMGGIHACLRQADRLQAAFRRVTGITQ